MEQKGIRLAGEEAGGCLQWRAFAARGAALAEASAFLAQALLALGLAPAVVVRAELILEELFLNSVLHGYAAPDSGAGPIWVGIGAARWYFQDAAPAFNPLSAPVRDEAPGGHSRLGGAGLPLIRHLGVAVDYQYRDGRNCISVCLAAEPE
jgi:anti-sigma regulatory factor (Ser/Thr protein kinase)